MPPYLPSSCPHCGSHQVRRSRARHLGENLTGLLLARHAYRCKACRRRFRQRTPLLERPLTRRARRLVMGMVWRTRNLTRGPATCPVCGNDEGRRQKIEGAWEGLMHQLLGVHPHECPYCRARHLSRP